MPYNNAAIPPSDEVTGTTVLPLARVKKILAADEDLGPVSNHGSFVIAKGAELFIQHLAEKSFNSAKAESKTKRSLTYNDIANIVARTDYLEFLSDIIPQTTTLRAVKEKKAREAHREQPGPRQDPLPAGQRTLDSLAAAPAPEPTRSTAKPLDGPDRPPIDGSSEKMKKDLVFQHYEPNGPRTREGDPEAPIDVDSDVEMQ